jgi:hypothetical protein
VDEARSHAATVEINRGMKGEYSIRVVARSDDANEALLRALDTLELSEIALGIESQWHCGTPGYNDTLTKRKAPTDGQ